VVHGINCIPYKINQNLLNLSTVTSKGDGILIAPLKSDISSLNATLMDRDRLLYEVGDYIVSRIAIFAIKPNACVVICVTRVRSELTFDLRSGD
jgi:hypothetical protein